jgi:putative DNA primase/helicase
MQNKEYLKSFISKGMKIFPCISNKKIPLTVHGYKDASLDGKTINDWWVKYPDANIGMVTGKQSNLVVVDVDVKNDAGGMDSLKQLQDECGEFNTRMVHTPSGGLHFYFKYPQDVDTIKNKAGMRPGIDIRADGGYVIAPGSSIDGNAYEFDDIDKEISELPQKLLDILTSSKPSANGSVHNEFAVSAGEVLLGVEEGGRNDSLFRLASKLRGEDVPFEIAKSQMLMAAHNCNPPLPNAEALRCLESAYSSYQPNSKNPTDVGNAQRLVSLFGADVKYVYEFKKWIHWDDTRWLFDEDGHMFRLAKKTARSISQEAANENDESRRRRLLQHALKSENKQQLEAMIQVAKTEEGMTISQSELDQDKYLLGVANGVVNLRTGGLIDNSKESMITKRGGTSFNPNSECPQWLTFVDEITDHNKELANYLKKIVGYSLTGETKEQLFFFLHGGGANGKSVFVNVIQDMLSDYSMQTPVSTIMTRGKGSINNDIARLRGARFVNTTETEEGSRFNESEVKLITGGDIISARFLHQEYFEYRPQFTLWISGNHKPVPGDGYSIWRRLILIPFNVRFSEDKQDKNLTSKLRNELPGILNWAIEGCLQWQNEGLTTPKVILDATKEYQTEMDRINSWMEDSCTNDASNNCSTKASDLYQSYKTWADNNGEWRMNQRILGTKLAERGFQKRRESKGWVYSGIQLDDSNNDQYDDF